MIQPPKTGPMIGATTTPMPKTAMATPRFRGGKLSIKIACDKGCGAPPAAPCTTRAKIRKPRLAAAPQAADANVKTTMQPIKKRLRPKPPPDSRSSATRSHWTPDSWSAPRWLRRCWRKDCPRCGHATLATDVSSTSRIVASITAMAMSQGLTLGRHRA